MTILLYFAVVLIWGTTWIAIFVQEHNAAIPVTVAVFWRFALASVVLLLVLKLSGRLTSLSRQTHLFCLLQGCTIFGINFICFYHAAQWINSGLESVIFSMAVCYNALNSWIFFRQKPPARFLPAVVIGIGGIIALFWPQLSENHISPQLLAGIGLSALGTLGFSLGNMISVRHKQRQQDTLTTTGYAMLYGALVMALLSLVMGYSLVPPGNIRWLGAVCYLAIIGSVCGFGAYFILLGRIGAAKASWSTLLFPLVALAFSAEYEGFVWQPHAIIGLAAISCANLLMFIRTPLRLRYRRT